MKKIYLCHDFNGIYDNAKKVIEYIDCLISYNNEALYVSPILLLGSLYYKLDNNLKVKYCLHELKSCDIMITFGKNSLSRDCLTEKEYCKNNNINIIDYIDYCKQYHGVG